MYVRIELVFKGVYIMSHWTLSSKNDEIKQGSFKVCVGHFKDTQSTSLFIKNDLLTSIICVIILQFKQQPYKLPVSFRPGI